MTDLLLRIIDFISLLLSLYLYVIIIYAVMSWLIAFNVVNSRNQLVRTVLDFLYRITEPSLAPILRRLPNLGGIDISPIILWLIIIFIQSVVLGYIRDVIAGGVPQ